MHNDGISEVVMARACAGKDGIAPPSFGIAASVVDEGGEGEEVACVFAFPDGMMARRRARDGKWYVLSEFSEFHGQAWHTHTHTHTGTKRSGRAV